MKTRAEWLEIVRRDYKHLTDEVHEELVEHIFKTHPDHQPVLVDTKPGLGPFPQLAEQPVAAVSNDAWLRLIFWAIILLIFATLLAPHLHAQGTSQIDVICIQNTNLSGGKSCFAAPFNLNFSTGFTCSRAGGTMTCTGGGSITNNPGGSSTQLQYNNAGAFGAIPSAGLGKVLIDQGPGSPPAFADPLVQGLYAAGTTTLPNPVIIGGHDYSGTPTLRLTKVDSSGNLYAVVTFASPQSVAQSGTWNVGLSAGANLVGKFGIDQTTPGTTNGVQVNAALPAGTNVIGHVINDSGSTTAVTGNVATTKADGSDVTLGAKADAKSTATDTTAVSVVSVLKQISASVQAPPSQAVTNAGTFAVQSTDAATSATGSAVPAKAIQVGQSDGTNLITPYLDPCQRGAKTYQTFSLTANTKIITGTSAKKVYFCSFNVVVGAATNVAVVEGTGTVCATGTATYPGLSGGTTAATGWNLAANGGLTFGNGAASIGGETTNADDVCIFVSAANQTSGGYSYVVY